MVSSPVVDIGEKPFHDESWKLGASRAIGPERQDVCFRGLDSRCPCSLHVRASSCHRGDVYWIIDSALLHHHDLGAIWNLDIPYAELVYVYRRSVSILRIPICADLDLPGHNVHKHPCYRITAGARYAMATGFVAHSHGSMFGRWHLHHDQT